MKNQWKRIKPQFLLQLNFITQHFFAKLITVFSSVTDSPPLTRLRAFPSCCHFIKNYSFFYVFCINCTILWFVSFIGLSWSNMNNWYVFSKIHKKYIISKLIFIKYALSGLLSSIYILCFYMYLILISILYDYMCDTILL